MARRETTSSASLITILCLACVLIILFAPIKTTYTYYDEGFAVQNAWRVLNGDLPYRDFWAIYPPGQFHALALVFKLLGTTLLAGRLYDTAVRFAIVIAVYLAAKRMGLGRLALVASLVSALQLAAAGFYTYAVFPAIGLGLAAILAWLQHGSSGGSRWLFFTGLLLGAACLFRWDIGAYACISIVLTMFLFRSRALARGWGLSIAVGPVPKAIGVIGAGLLCATAPCLGYFAVRGGLSELWQQAVVFPIVELPRLRWLPYPSVIPRGELLAWARFYLPGIISLATVAHLRCALKAPGRMLRGWYVSATVIGLYGALLFAQALSRNDSIHLVPTSIVTGLLITLLIRKILEGFGEPVMKAIILLPLVAAYLTVYVWAPARELLTAASQFPPLGCYSHLAAAGCVRIGDAEEDTVRYIVRRTADGEAIFVGNQQHDLIHMNDIGFYFLAARPAATRYSELYPGVATTLPVQEAIVRDLESKHVKWIVLVDVPPSAEPNASSVSSGVRYLDEYIRREYEPVRELGAYSVWRTMSE